MKKLLSLFLAFLLLFALVSCKKKTEEPAPEVTPVTLTLDSTKFAAPAALRTAVSENLVEYAVLPEPMVTIAASQNGNVKVAMDIGAVWQEYFGKNSLLQGCVVVRTAFLEEHPAEVAAFMQEYAASVNFVKENPHEAAQMIAENGIFEKAAVAEKAIPKCNLLFLSGAEMKTGLAEFFAEMPLDSLGGSLPGDDFYFLGNNGGTPDGAPAVRVATLNGTTGFGMAKLMNDKSAGTATLNYDFTVETEATNIVKGLINGSIDIGALPTNAAATVYNKTSGGVKVLAVNTGSVLYLVTTNGAENLKIADLNGKTLYCPAQNPAFILSALFKKAGVTVQ